MNLKKIQAMPFAPFHEESKVRWKVTVKEPVVVGNVCLWLFSGESLLHCVSERYAFLPYRLRKEKQGGKGHQSRGQDSAEGSELFQHTYVVV